MYINFRLWWFRYRISSVTLKRVLQVLSFSLELNVVTATGPWEVFILLNLQLIVIKCLKCVNTVIGAGDPTYVEKCSFCDDFT